MGADELDKFILGNFGGVVKDCPWEDAPGYVVYRHGDNRKWFALKFAASKEQLLRLKNDDVILNDYADGEMVEIVNVKVDPEMVADVVREAGFLPAFHMNRKHWVTILLDAEVDAARLRALVEMSYNLTARKYKARNGGAVGAGAS